MILTCIFINFSALAQIDPKDHGLDYFLPPTEYDESIMTPKDFLGYQVAEWHVTHDQLVSYMRYLSEASDRISFSIIGLTYEKRKLINLIITNPDNHARLNVINENHQRLADPTYKEKIETEDLPAVLYQGYSIHGDESSGGNAALAVAYFLAAGQSSFVNQILKDLVIIFDPCYNPDGFQRYASWVNSNQDKMHTTDPTDISHNEPWPTGRTNHYWFDLNRDWLLLTHPESRARIEIFQNWNPNVLTDHHEMGKNSSFFFQPGVPSRTNPLTPQINQDLTERIGEYHSAALDSIGSDYFSKERFDDFYYGKGSTYPDGQGCVGILFEQATSEGILQETNNGLLSFPFCVRNQVVTSLSTYRAMLKLRPELIKYKQEFFRDRYEQAQEDPVQAYIFNQPDKWKRDRFAEILNRHKIQTKKSKEDFTFGGHLYKSDQSIIVPVQQKQYTLIKSIFEPQTTFTDSIFYDVSTWNFPMAFDGKFARMETGDMRPIKLSNYKPVVDQSKEIDSPSSWIISWSHYMAPALKYKLEQLGIPHSVLSNNMDFGGQKLAAGSILIKEEDSPDNLQEILENFKIDRTDRLAYDSDNFVDKEWKAYTGGKKNIGILVGDGVSSYEAGDTWFQLDQRWNIPSTRIELEFLEDTDLSRYSTIIMPDGRYDLDTAVVSQVRKWVLNGGNLIAMRRAIKSVQDFEMIKLRERKAMPGKEEIEGGGQVIGGSIFMSEVNLEDPLFYGYPDNEVAMFKKGTQWYQAKEASNLEIVAKYTDKPLFSGYSSKENLFKAGGSASVMRKRYGNGTIILLVDNPNFRGFWYGGATLFANSIFNNK